MSPSCDLRRAESVAVSSWRLVCSSMMLEIVSHHGHRIVEEGGGGERTERSRTWSAGDLSVTGTGRSYIPSW